MHCLYPIFDVLFSVPIFHRNRYYRVAFFPFFFGVSIFDLFYFPSIYFISFWFFFGWPFDYSPEPSYVLMHSDVWNCDIKAFLPTPGAPNMNTRYESTGAREWCESAGEWCGDIGLLGARLLLLERRRRNESPRLMTPATKRNNKIREKDKLNTNKWKNAKKEIKSDQSSWRKEANSG